MSTQTGYFYTAAWCTCDAESCRSFVALCCIGLVTSSASIGALDDRCLAPEKRGPFSPLTAFALEPLSLPCESKYEREHC